MLCVYVRSPSPRRLKRLPALATRKHDHGKLNVIPDRRRPRWISTCIRRHESRRLIECKRTVCALPCTLLPSASIDKRAHINHFDPQPSLIDTRTAAGTLQAAQAPTARAARRAAAPQTRTARLGDGQPTAARAQAPVDHASDGRASRHLQGRFRRGETG